ncbi:MAG: Na/Pi cotransporter family protein [Ruminococcaceae bacterium]|nr:Na/Pi cotransporter family protein [Oscillospiraceae bacterium]
MPLIVQILTSAATLLGGLALFLYGMNMMTNGLEKMAGGKLETILKKASSNKFKGIALGAGVTAVIQSSSATTVMIVGLVGSGIMALPQTIGMLMGTNIGTTITPWITGLADLGGGESAGWLSSLKLLKPDFFAPIIAVIGIILIMFFAKKNRINKDIGALFLGFAILMQGMELMSSAVEFLTDTDNESIVNTLISIVSFFDSWYGVILALILATLFTTVVQSSSASVGVLQAIVMATVKIDPDLVSFKVAIPIILGFNIGTCVTAVISSLGANRNAKRVAITHLVIKIFAVALCFVPFFIMTFIPLNNPWFAHGVNVWTIAIFHTLFNVVTTFILLPASKLFEKIAFWLVKDKQEKEKVAYIDPILISQSPAVALSECANLTVEMCALSKGTLDLSIDSLYNYDPKTAQSIIDNEALIDKYEDHIGTYLVQISSRALSNADSKKSSKLLHTIGDFERLSDHALNIVNVSEELKNKNIVFSDEAKAEIAVITDAIKEILNITSNAFVNDSIDVAKRVEPLEQVIDKLIATTKMNHITRLQKGACTIELGFVLSDLLNNYERISDHCSNIAVAIIETSHNSFGTHEYLNHVKNDNNEMFQAEYKSFADKYTISVQQ